MNNKKIDYVALIAPIYPYIASEDKTYMSKKGAIIIQYEDGTKSTLALECKEDLTNNTDIEFKIGKDSKIKTLFKRSDEQL